STRKRVCNHQRLEAGTYPSWLPRCGRAADASEYSPWKPTANCRKFRCGPVQTFEWSGPPEGALRTEALPVQLTVVDGSARTQVCGGCGISQRSRGRR